MPYQIDVYLKNTRNGDNRVYRPDFDYTDDDPFSVFIWEQGNFSCDCNRALFLYDWEDDQLLDCNTGISIITIDKIVRRDTGEVLYTEIAA